MSNEMLDAFAFDEYGKINDKKIWLSRTNLKYGKIANERLIENIVAKLGFEIVSPEKLSLSDQVRIIIATY